MKCNCKICRNNLDELVEKLFSTNSSFSTIVSTLKTNKCETNEDTVKRHLEKMGLYTPTELDEEEVPLVYENPLSFDLNNINFDRYDYDSTSAIEAVAYLQKVHLYLYYKQLEIVAREQDNFYKGLTDAQPTQSITRLKQLYELLDNITGISVYASQQSAIRKLELMGLKVEQFSPYTARKENENV